MPPVSCVRAMHNEPQAFVLRAVRGLLQDPFSVVQTQLVRYAMRMHLTSPLFANVCRTAANIVCFQGHYAVVMRDEGPSTTDGRRLPRVSDGCASCFNGKIICRHILSPKIADWLCIAMLTSHNIEWKLTNGENVTIYGCNRPGPPEVTSSVVFPSEYQSSCRISWIHTRLTGLRSSIAVADCQQWLRFLFSVKNLSLNIATATLVAVDNTGETGGSQNDSLKVARTLPRPGRAIATANT